jgi:hypothetical protein
MGNLQLLHKIRRFSHSVASSGLGRTVADIVAQRLL